MSKQREASASNGGGEQARSNQTAQLSPQVQYQEQVRRAQEEARRAELERKRQSLEEQILREEETERAQKEAEATDQRLREEEARKRLEEVLPSSDSTSNVLTELLTQLRQEQSANVTPENPAIPLEELLRQLSMSNSSDQNDNVVVGSTQAQLPNNSPTMSVQQGIALAQGANIVLDGTDRRPPENHEINGDLAHTVLSDLNAIYHYEGDGLLGVTSHFGHALFDWVQSHPFANFRKNEADRRAMLDLVRSLAPFKEDPGFCRNCEALEASFTQEQEDYPTNSARACMLIVSLFLHPEEV
ncbi:MAG: hypothetical protein LW808_002205 [Verrucomicrobiota bacterium]|nr:MAG: hypothetical protein LW808_002205 [Verrucomicrobiota bacterium]